MKAPALAIAERALFVLMVGAVAIGLESFGYTRHAGGFVMLLAAFTAIVVTAWLAARGAFASRAVCVLLAAVIVAAFAALNFEFLHWLRVDRLHQLSSAQFAHLAGWYGPGAAVAIAASALLSAFAGARRVSTFAGGFADG